jgi:pimeloyl-ACP methyl ester carboxylesterase
MKSGVLDLADGRQLEYGSFGPPDAPPVMYCHGFPTNRLELELIEPALTQSGLDVQVVALNRPGYGDSSFQPRRTLLDWPRDVVEAADLLELGEFAVLGVSGGGPYALACALAVPDRVSRLGIAVGMGPAEADGMDNSLTFRTVQKSAMIRRFQFGMIALGLNRGQEKKVLEKSLANFSQPDLSVLERPEMQDWFIRVMKQSFKQGGRGAAHDAGLYLNDWGFDPGDINVETHLWYGGSDSLVPDSVGQWLADRIPTSTYQSWPKHGHFTWMETESVGVVEQITRT